MGCISPVMVSVSTMLGLGDSVTTGSGRWSGRGDWVAADLTKSQTTPVDGESDVFEGRLDGGMWLVHGHLDGVHQRVAQAHVGDPLGQGLDQVDRVVGDRGPDLVDEGPVVDRVLQIVTAGSHPRVHAEDEVDHELLAVTALVLEDAVVPVDRQTTHREAVADWVSGWVTRVVGHRGPTLPAPPAGPERPSGGETPTA